MPKVGPKKETRYGVDYSSETIRLHACWMICWTLSVLENGEVLIERGNAPFCAMCWIRRFITAGRDYACDQD